MLQVEIHTDNSIDSMDLQSLHIGDDPALLKRFEKIKSKKVLTATQKALFDVMDKLAKLPGWKLSGFYKYPNYDDILTPVQNPADLPSKGSFGLLFDNKNNFFRK